MADLLSIAASGVNAARTALTVTGENIANVDTPGYRRRDTLQTEITAAQTTPLIRGLDHQGVQVTEIRRAFDQILAARSREAAGGLAAAEAAAPWLQQMETRLMEEGGGPLPKLGAFFDALSNLAAAPQDMGLRRVTLLTGQAMVTGVADLARGVQDMRGAVATQADVALAEANRLIGALGDLQAGIAVQQGTGGRNPLLDRRDAMLTDLAKLVDITVSLGPKGVAEVRLGSVPGGPLLVAGAVSGHLVAEAPGRLTARALEPGGPDATRVITGGRIGGLAAADAALAELGTGIDLWAGAIARDLNAAHAEGLDLQGRPGGALLSLAGWEATPRVANRGDAVASVTVTDPARMPAGPIELVHDAGAGLWRASGRDGAPLAEGPAPLQLPGLSVRIEGVPADGDRLTLRDTGGWAGNLRWLVTDPAALAAAGALRIEADPRNAGAARLSATPVTLPPAPQPDLSALLAGGGTVEFLAQGSVARLPAGTGAATLMALPREAASELAPPPGAGIAGLTLDLPGGAVSFAAAPALDPAAFATALRDGTLRTGTGARLADLGLTLTAEAGRLTLTAAEGTALPPATLATTAGNVAAVTLSDAAPAATLAVFTREGRQVAGPPLTAAAAQALMTPANGFLPGASLGAAGRLAVADRITAAGQTALMLGADAGILTGPLPPPGAPASTLTLDGPGLSGALALPEGTSAARRAELLEQAFPLTASARTAVALTLPASGRISLSLTGDALAASPVTADLAGGPGALARAINAATPLTGITAELSPDGARLMLVHPGGADIVIGGLAHDGGAGLGLARLGPDGAPLGAALTLAPGGSARVTGTVTLQGAGAFAATEDGVLRQGVADGFAGGALARTITAAGAVQVLRPAGAGIAPGLAIATPDGREIAAQPVPGWAGLDAPGQAAALLAGLRATAPASTLTGAPLAAPPPVGASVRLMLGEDAYALRMTATGLQVDGPEPGRLTAGFAADGRLVVATVGGDLDGAALRLPADGAEAARFGLGAGSAPLTRLTGQPPTALPASFGIEIGGTRHDLTLTAAGVSLPPGFPGGAATDPATGALLIDIDARAGAIRIPPEPGAAAAGLVTLGVSARLAGDGLTLTATDGRRLETRALGAGSAQVLRLSDLPAEELLVVMTGPGALRLGGAVTPAATTLPSPREVRVIDAAAGLVGLYDSATGTELATRSLDASGSAVLGGLSVTLTGTLADGDRFAVTPNTGAQGDGRMAGRMADLAAPDPSGTRGGFAARYAEIMGDFGADVAAAGVRITTATARKEAADRAEAGLSAVDLDTEAARLLQQQQAYQASAQVLSVARQLFDTLINAL